MKKVDLTIVMCFSLVLFIMSCKSDESSEVDNLVRKYTSEELKQAYKARSIGAEKPDTAFFSNTELESVDINLLETALFESQRLIYGNDNIKDWYQVKGNATIEKYCNGVCAMINKSELTLVNGFYILKGNKSFKSVHNTCNNERFMNQPIISECSAFAISRRMVATAGHCLNESNYNSYLFVYGYRMLDYKNPELKIPASNVFKCTRILDRKKDASLDYTIFAVDKDISPNRIWKIRTSGVLQKNQILDVAGYPLGLPVKFADSGKVRDNTNPNSFLSNLDVYGGNSGSPVFDHHTGIVEGILTGGEVDFTFDLSKNCRKSLICPVNGCQGERISRTSQFLAVFNANKGAY
jgi:hypothetical protein